MHGGGVYPMFNVSVKVVISHFRRRGRLSRSCYLWHVAHFLKSFNPLQEPRE